MAQPDTEPTSTPNKHTITTTADTTDTPVTTAAANTPVAPQTAPDTTTPAVVAVPQGEAVTFESKFSKLKLAFLYVLIGGLALSAVISVVAILIGEFSQGIQKALLTTFVLVIHSLLVLTVISADTRNQLGKSLVPTAILTVFVANMITSVLGIWEIWPSEFTWRMINVYAIGLGIAFLISFLQRLRIAHTTTQTLTYVSVGLLSLLGLVLVPWALFPDAFWVNDLYYRVIGAVSILAITTTVITVIISRIAIGQNAGLAATTPEHQPYSPAMLAITISVGVIVSLFWFSGLLVLLISAADNSSNYTQPSNQYDGYDRSYDRYN